MPANPLRRGVEIGAHIASVGTVEDRRFDPVAVTAADLRDVAAKPFPVLDDDAGVRMQAEIDAARLSLDSVGGSIECAATGFPGGIGGPMFDLAWKPPFVGTFGIPAVRGVEFGAGCGGRHARFRT